MGCRAPSRVRIPLAPPAFTPRPAVPTTAGFFHGCMVRDTCLRPDGGGLGAAMLCCGKHALDTGGNHVGVHAMRPIPPAAAIGHSCGGARRSCSTRPVVTEPMPRRCSPAGGPSARNGEEARMIDTTTTARAVIARRRAPGARRQGSGNRRGAWAPAGGADSRGAGPLSGTRPTGTNVLV